VMSGACGLFSKFLSAAVTQNVAAKSVAMTTVIKHT